ncbi:MAG TPA: GFA family protein [Labilithrix sp.]|nr:GFA family protein [Labilithrix sp.]
MTLHSFEGGCHCRRVRFRVRTERLEALDCNCSICAMKGFLHLLVEKEAFTLLSGEDDLTTYTFNTGLAKHMFCRVCGIHSFYIPRSHPDGVDVNVRCLDDDALARFTVTPFDGREWEANVSSIR